MEYCGELLEQDSMGETDHSSDGEFLYFFKHDQSRYCIDASKETGRYGRLVNHSRKSANAMPKIVVINQVPRLVLEAKRWIDIGEEILYDYGDRTRQALDAHPWLKE